MKKLILSGLMLAPVALMAQSDFSLKGKTKTIPNGNKIYLMYADAGKRITDSAVVNQGTFEFKGKISSPVSASLINNVSPAKMRSVNSKTLDLLAIYVEPGNMVLKSADSLKSAVFESGNVNKDNAKFIALTKKFTDAEAALNAEYAGYTKEQKNDKALIDVLIEKFEKIGKEKTPVIVKFIQDNPKSFVSLTQLSRLMSNDDVAGQLESLYTALSPELKESALGKNINKSIEAAKKTAIGVMAMDFTQNDPDGKPVKLSDFRGKYVLIDFWASWCGPCRDENPNVVAAYQQFKDKNFTVLGVSLDGGSTRTTKEAWLKAVADDKLTWTHVSDLNGWNNEVSTAWGVRAIPANFLIDPQGKIVAKGLRGKALHDKLAELLK